MRRALQENGMSTRQGASWTTHLSSPVGGWNTRDSLAEMDPRDAVELDNWFPRGGQMELRGGCQNWATGLTGSVKSLFQYRSPSAAGKFYGVTDAGVYEISTTGAVGAVKKALSNGYVHGLTLTNSAGSTFYWFANGTDDPVLFDGATWTSLNGASTPAITGVTTNLLVYPWLFKHRIFVIEKSSMNMYYLPIDSIAGVASKFPLGNLFRRGGSLNAGTSWTLDSGQGPDDLLAIITTEGELAVYKGTNPASASSWEIVGVWFVGKPLSRRCFFKLGGDVGVLVENGVFMLSQLLQSGEANFSNALSKKIQPTISQKVNLLGPTTTGWEGCVYPQFDALIVNVPGGIQWVMNTVTQAWCSFSNWNALCFEVRDGVLFFGRSDGTVQQAWNGAITADNGADISTIVQTAWNYFGNRTMLKNLGVFRPLLAWNGSIAMNWGVGAEYEEIDMTSYYPRQGSNATAKWGSGVWGTSTWQATLLRYKKWLSAVHPPGYTLSLRLQTLSNDSSLTWSGTDFILERGGAM